MTQTSYQRVDPAKLEARELSAGASEAGAVRRGGVAGPAAGAAGRLEVRLWIILPLSLLFCLAQAVLTIVVANIYSKFFTATLIPVLAFAVLFAAVLLVNPLLRLVRVRRFGRAELVCLFSAMLVTSGLSTFGLTAQIVPLLATPWNPEWNTPQRGWGDNVLPYLNESLYITDAETIRTFRLGVPITKPRADADWPTTFAYYGQVVRAIPWGAWIRPLAWWSIFLGACYGMFYFLTYVVLDYWDKREKLIFPLAKLGESLLPESDEQRTWLPPMFRSVGFWAAFAIVFGVHSWNVATWTGWFAGVDPIPLGMPTWSATGFLEGTVLEGMSGSSMGIAFLVMFTAIGIAFLLPLETSFSIWFYWLLGLMFMQSAVWMGYGKNMKDFPSDWLWQNNIVTAQGAGGILLFSAVSLYRCVREYIRLALTGERSFGDRLRIAMPVIGLAVCMAIMTGWLGWNKLGWWSIIVVAFLTLLTLGLMRIVAEGGIYWFQAHASFFHSYKWMGIGGWGPLALKPVLLGPLLLVYSVLFLDIKTFLAPNMLNAAKMQEDAGRSRFKFHFNLIVCLVVTVVVALGFEIFLAHMRGAQQMSSWFYSSGPQHFMDTASRAASEPSEFNGVTGAWYGVGATWVALSMIVRRTLFWFPHPIGYIMLINPLMAQLWFSFFVGWICKKITVKYGGKATFDQVRVIFIGLIMGELMAICIWNLLGPIYGFTVPSNVDLNRYGFAVPAALELSQYT